MRKNEWGLSMVHKIGRASRRPHRRSRRQFCSPPSRFMAGETPALLWCSTPLGESPPAHLQRSFLLVDGFRLGLWRRSRDVGCSNAGRRSGVPQEVFEDGQISVEGPAAIFAQVALEFLQLIRGG